MPMKMLLNASAACSARALCDTCVSVGPEPVASVDPDSPFGPGWEGWWDSTEELSVNTRRSLPDTSDNSPSQRTGYRLSSENVRFLVLLLGLVCLSSHAIAKP